MPHIYRILQFVQLLICAVYLSVFIGTATDTVVPTANSSSALHVHFPLKMHLDLPSEACRRVNVSTADGFFVLDIIHSPFM